MGNRRRDVFSACQFTGVPPPVMPELMLTNCKFVSGDSTWCLLDIIWFLDEYGDQRGGLPFSHPARNQMFQSLSPSLLEKVTYHEDTGK